MLFSMSILTLLLVHVLVRHGRRDGRGQCIQAGLKYIENIHNFGTSGLSEDFRSVLDS